MKLLGLTLVERVGVLYISLNTANFFFFHRQPNRLHKLIPS